MSARASILSSTSISSALLLLVASVPAAASVAFTSQMRRVEVVASGPQAFAEAADFGIFDRSVHWSDPIEGHGGTATQQSVLLADRVAISSALTAADGRSGFTASAGSSLDVSFMLDQPSPATLTGSWAMTTQLTGVSLSGRVRLTRDGVPVWSSPISTSMSTLSPVGFDFAGELAAGTYRFEASASLLAALIPGFTSGTGSLVATLAIPGPTVGSALALGLAGTGAGRGRRPRDLGPARPTVGPRVPS